MRPQTVRQVAAFAVIFAALTVAFDYFRGVPVGQGTALAVIVAVAVYAGLLWRRDRRRGDNGEE